MISFSKPTYCPVFLPIMLVLLISVSRTICIDDRESQFDVNVVNIDGVCTVKRSGDGDDLRELWESLDLIVKRDYFRYFKANLEEECPYWAVHIMCTGALTDEGQPIAPCHVCKCDENEIPFAVTQEEMCGSGGIEPQPQSPSISPVDAFMDKKVLVDHTISRADEKGWMWKWDEENAVYVDLVRNPESYTGYEGEEANRIWSAIYNENCFTTDLNSMCVEDRIFYRLMSGLHASISTHLSVHHTQMGEYPTEEDMMTPDYQYRPHLGEFMRRVGHHQDRIDNLHLLHFFVIRAISKARPFLGGLSYATGEPIEDKVLPREMLLLLNNRLIHSTRFNETLLFREDHSKEQTLAQLKNRFTNITSLMDCLTCEKCRLWGKLQTLGLATAMKIVIADVPVKSLRRSEVVVCTLFFFSCLCSHS
eukprot:TRINITY_DN67063_c2_g7_i1.p1 TRINITY_DN67063_c2_g7~~TRINITY_DN67063_c2_g7_i1.p1  ORF type:complete len:429 (-),score=7.46 TRINITY_DN67063_c2_g7_i1:341-1603(-)